jgi:hypothetical protein
MATLVEISSNGPNTVQIWGFQGPCNVRDVDAALKTIASTLVGPGHVIHVMSGTHGYCKGKIGAVATRDERFLIEDRGLEAPLTQDHKAVIVDVQDFNNGHLEAPDPITAAMAKLNAEIRRLSGESPTMHTFLLAYCCSAGQ